MKSEQQRKTGKRPAQQNADATTNVVSPAEESMVHYHQQHQSQRKGGGKSKIQVVIPLLL